MTWTREKFQRRLDDALTLRKVTQTELADKLGLHQSAVSDWLSEKKNREPSIGQVEQIGEALNLRPHWLAFDNDFEPMDDEETAMIATFRKLNEAERAKTVDLMATITAGRETIKKPGKRTLLKVTADHDLGIMAVDAPMRSSASAQSLSQSDKYPKTPLPSDERIAALKWILGQAKTMKKGLLLPKALRKIATQLADDSVSESSEEKSGQASQAMDASGKAAPKAAAPHQHPALPQKGRHSS